MHGRVIQPETRNTCPSAMKTKVSPGTAKEVSLRDQNCPLDPTSLGLHNPDAHGATETRLGMLGKRPGLEVGMTPGQAESCLGSALSLSGGPKPSRLALTGERAFKTGAAWCWRQEHGAFQAGLGCTDLAQNKMKFHA